jgi:hypothetical protein
MDNHIAKEKKTVNEIKSIEKIRDTLGDSLGNELYKGKLSRYAPLHFLVAH